MPSIDGKFSTYRILKNTRRSLKHKSAQSDAPATDQGAQVGQENQEIDLQTLAHKVYNLLKQELEVERERLGRSGR